MSGSELGMVRKTGKVGIGRDLASARALRSLDSRSPPLISESQNGRYRTKGPRLETGGWTGRSEVGSESWEVEVV
jgi:hypothetical protein